MNNLINQIRNKNYLVANSIIKQISGVVNFFSSEEEKSEFVSVHDNSHCIVCEDRASYGDWQTPISLARKICESHISKFGEPDIVIEPTCGLGAFVFSALEKFHDLSEIHAIEINHQYTNELKLKLLLDALNKPSTKHPDIYIYNADFFEFDFSPIIEHSKKNNWSLAIIGNPPWVTNSRQGKENSHNIPIKRNNYGLKGIDAITGKSNFDISEYITLELLKLSHINQGGISFLLKNSVIRNILIKQNTEHLHIGHIEQKLIDASSEFNVSVDASYFSAQFNCIPSSTCQLMDFYTNSYIKEFGWIDDSFVADIEMYKEFSRYDNVSTLVWRSGIKHDCASVLELSLSNGVYTNKLNEVVDIEDDLIYPLLKSSDLNNYQENKFRKFLIIPQRNMADDTSSLKYTHPLAYSYLIDHETAFSNRKSSIYKGKDKFSVFGIGEYSFKPYKIVVSSLYKTINFILVSQFEGKPIMVDDTCYQLDFDNKEDAQYIYDAINSNEIQSLLKSLIFKDAKRVITKSLLMRLDLLQVCKGKGIMKEPQCYHNSTYKQLSLFD